MMWILVCATILLSATEKALAQSTPSGTTIDFRNLKPKSDAETYGIIAGVLIAVTLVVIGTIVGIVMCLKKGRYNLQNDDKEQLWKQRKESYKPKHHDRHHRHSQDSEGDANDVRGKSNMRQIEEEDENVNDKVEIELNEIKVDHKHDSGDDGYNTSPKEQDVNDVDVHIVHEGEDTEEIKLDMKIELEEAEPVTIEIEHSKDNEDFQHLRGGDHYPEDLPQNHSSDEDDTDSELEEHTDNHIEIIVTTPSDHNIEIQDEDKYITAEENKNRLSEMKINEVEFFSSDEEIEHANVQENVTKRISESSEDSDESDYSEDENSEARQLDTYVEQHNDTVEHLDSDREEHDVVDNEANDIVTSHNVSYNDEAVVKIQTHEEENIEVKTSKQSVSDSEHSDDEIEKEHVS